MVIPTGVNFYEFYKAAQKKGVRVSSRYSGVVINEWKNSNTINWVAKYQSGGKLLFHKNFQFTEQGELQASQAYERFLKDNGIVKRNATKRKYKFKTKQP